MEGGKSKNADEETPLVDQTSYEESTIISPIDESSESFDKPQWKAQQHRISILTQDAWTDLEEVVGPETVAMITTTSSGVGVQCIIFCLLTTLIGLSPGVMQFALWDPEQGRKVANFLPQGPYVMEFLMASLLANVISFIAFGAKGLKECWNFNRMLKLSPISILHGASESVELLAMVYLDGAFRSVLSQLKLPIVALIRRVFLNERRSIVQWIFICSITIAVWGFIFSDIKTQSSSIRATEIMGPGLGLGLAALLFGIFAGLAADILTKRSGQRYIIQMSQIRTTTMLVVLILMIIYAKVKNELWKIPFYGWNWRVVILTGWLLMKDFVMIYVVKRFDSFWPAIAASAGLCLAFITDVAFFKESFRPLSFFFICLVSVLIICYALSGPKKVTPSSNQ